MVWTYPTVCCTIEIFEKSNVWTSRAIKSYYVWIILDNLPKLSTFIFTECSAKCCGSECHSAEQQSDGLLYVGISCGIVAAVIFFIMVIIFILRKIRREGKDETYIDPTHDFDTTNHHQPAGLNYNASPNYVGVEQDQLQIHWGND